MAPVAEPLDEEFSDIDEKGPFAEGIRPMTEPPRMLDTNIRSDAVPSPFGRTTQFFEHFDESGICTSAIVASETRYGAPKKASPRLTEPIEETRASMNLLPDVDAASLACGIMRSETERQGKPICCGDLLIAAYVRSLGLTLDIDYCERSRADGLKIENWLEEEVG